MEPLLLFPDPAPPAVAQALDLSGYPWKAAASLEAAERLEPDDGWAGAIVCAAVDPDGAFTLCRSVRKRDLPLTPLLLVIDAEQVGELELREDLFDDFCVMPWRSQELEARLAHLFWRTGRGTRPELVEYGPLVLNLETYQAALPGRPLDLTFMEYELLKFLATHPGKVFTREVLLSRFGATSITAGPAPLTSISAGCGRSWARSTPISSRPSVRWDTASARADGALPSDKRTRIRPGRGRVRAAAQAPPRFLCRETRRSGFTGANWAQLNRGARQ